MSNSVPFSYDGLNNIIERKQSFSKHVFMDANSKYLTNRDVKLTHEQTITAILGLMIYFSVFIFLIPYVLYKLGWFDFLKLYFINTDLIATVISFDKGPFKNIFKYLYTDVGPFIGFISQSLINLSVLLGVFYIILSDTRGKKITHGLSKVAFIITITYLLPSRFILQIMDKFYIWLQGWNSKINGEISYEMMGILSILIGFFVAIIFISIETLSIKHLSPHLKRLLDNIF